MSREKNIRFGMMISENDKMMLTELAEKLDCSESYVVRKAIKLIYEKEFTGEKKNG